MVSKAVYVSQYPIGSVSASTFPVAFPPLPVRGYEIKHAVSNQKPDHAIAEPYVSFEWVTVFKAPLDELHSKVYRLVQPIWVQVERYGSGYLVTDEDVNRHGVGSTIEAALRNYEEILLNYFESLSRRQERLSPRLKQHLEFLRDTISHVQ